ncbi:MAG: ATP-dependent Clp protease proteolytic subunit [Candidatus Paceibacterota bacterium]|jgi:ATP-dependent Clp protease protease subunit
MYKTDLFELYDTKGKLLTREAAERPNASKFNLGEGLQNKMQLSLLEKAEPEIRLYGTVNEEMAHYVRMALEFLYAETSQPPLKAIITSTGGSVNAGLEIGSLLSEYMGGVHGYVQGYAYSAAAQYILPGCLVRYAHKHSRLMCHYVRANIQAGEHDLTNGDTVEQILKNLKEPDEQDIEMLVKKIQMRQILKDLKDSNDQTVEILVERTGQSVEEVRKLLCKGEIKTAQECKEFGLIDAVFSYKVTKMVDESGRPRFQRNLVMG